MSSAPIDLNPHRASKGEGGEHRYFAVPVSVLAGLVELQCDVYIQHPMSAKKLLYRSASSNLPVADQEKLKQRNIRYLYLRGEDRDRFARAVREALAATGVNPAVRLTLTIEQHRDTLQCALRQLSAAPVVAAAAKVAADLLQVVNQDNFSVGMVVSLLDHDRCTFQHSCNVAVYAATLAKRIGLDENELGPLTSGGLLHDVGKRHIPAHILRKPGKLDGREREMIRRHPTAGFRELAALRQLTWGQLMMAYQHHEWISGVGYPVGISGEEIHSWAHVCAVADVFDALTTNRPYREAGHAGAALEIMTKEAGHFDPELVHAWVEIVTA